MQRRREILYGFSLTGLGMVASGLLPAPEAEAASAAGQLAVSVAPNGAVKIAPAAVLPAGPAPRRLHYRYTSAPANGAVVRSGRPGDFPTLTYRPRKGFVGADRFQVLYDIAGKARRTEVTVTVGATAPVALGGWGVGPRSGLPFWSGTAQGATSVGDIERLRGRPVDIVTTFGPRESWTDVAGGIVGASDLGGWFSGHFADTYFGAARILCSYGYFPSTPVMWRAAYEEAATGAYDSYWSAWSAKLKRLREYNPAMQVPVIRLGWEMNVTSSYPWFIADTPPATYIATWRRLVSIIRADHPDAPICWCPLKGNRLPYPMAAYWPGNDYVDVVGVDYYARSMKPEPTSAASFRAFADSGDEASPRGINRWLAFAQQRGKPLAVPEWGLVLHFGGKKGAHGDAPEFIGGMHDFFHANADALAFESYFNLADNLLDPIAAPQSRGRYQAGWRA